MIEVSPERRHLLKYEGCLKWIPPQLPKRYLPEHFVRAGCGLFVLGAYKGCRCEI